MSKPNIDAVYTWVDGSDPKFAKKRQQYYKNEYPQNLEKIANLDERFIESNELYYSVRSLRKFAPFIKNIYIITDNQVPWFIQNNILKDQRITIIDHTTIFKGYEEFLPTFSSRSIEAVFHRIPGLSDKFIYLNDDLFLVNEVTEENFIIDGKYLMYGGLAPKNRYLNKAWQLLFNNAANEARQGLVGLKNEIADAEGFFVIRGAHVPQIIERESYAKIISHDVLLDVLKYRFRSMEQMRTRALWQNYLLYRKKASLCSSGWRFYMPSTALRTVEEYQNDHNKKILFTSFQSICDVDEVTRSNFFEFLEARLLN